MLGLLFLYWVGKYYYKLAEKYNKKKWGFAILGIASYYAGILIASVVAGLLIGLYAPQLFDSINDLAFGLMMLPFGFLTTFGLYKFLKMTWIKNEPNPDEVLRL
jgi:purine-cytosine permease-like protein